DASIRLLISGPKTGSGGGYLLGTDIGGTLTGAANDVIEGLRIETNLAEAGGGTHPIIAGLRVVPSIAHGAASTADAAGIYVDGSFTAGPGTTNASAIKIASAPTGASNNYALWAEGGSFRFDNAGPHAIG